ncbi:hypothetical protein [Campylobacter upsaliensis]|uniref:hypothetical protein n=1 Tax=Campylobacter upsaliensis TaxID=28080 RepID=UPI00138AAC19|nr:hypothetical protein [Campylobacter upsaliensis]EAL4839977.1 hypothetical protein [Campylobacter jejuni]ELL7596700.1 hypothetical protein [Campylobacter jejuni]EME2750608.1 hypothetical protein [Campylobacter jejuni]
MRKNNIFHIILGIGTAFGLNYLIKNTQQNENLFKSKKNQVWLLAISYILYFFYTLSNNQKLILNFIALNEVIIFFKLLIVIQSIYFSHLLAQSMPQKYQNLPNKVIVFLFSLMLIIVGYFIVFSMGLIAKT